MPKHQLNLRQSQKCAMQTPTQHFIRVQVDDESPIPIPRTQSAFRPLAQRDAFPSSPCASATKAVCPLQSTADIQPQLQPALLRLSAMISQYFTVMHLFLFCSPRGNDKIALESRISRRWIAACPLSPMHVYELCPRKDKRGFDLISDVLPFGRLWYDGPNYAIGRAMHHSRSHDVVIRVYDAAGKVIETHEHKGEASLVAISQRDCVSAVDVRSDLSNRQLAGGNVTTENVNIVADEANRTGSAALTASTFALEFNAN